VTDTDLFLYILLLLTCLLVSDTEDKRFK